MTSPEAWHNAWSEVDRTADPQFFIRFLDDTRKHHVRAAYADPRKFFEHLNVQPGDHILEIGCGVGDTLLALADLAGPKGRVVGVDASRAMISEAERRAGRAEASVEFLICDAQHLDLPAGEFDHCLASSVMQHLDCPEKALSELVRVARPGGGIVINETDWDTQVVDAADIETTRRVVNFFCDSIRNGRIARRLPALMKAEGLADIRVEAWSSLCSSVGEPMGEWLCQSAQRAADAGAISREEVQDWLADIAERDRRGAFFAAYTTFRVSGRKPAQLPGEIGPQSPQY